MNSIDVSKRIDVLDYLRGFALLGIILVNILPLLSVSIPAQDTADAGYWRFLYLFVEGRFFTIFSFLFGVGFYLFITRANDKNKKGTVLFLRRILVMFIFGFIHSMYHPGEALTVYAVSGLLVLPFSKLKKETNLVIGLTLLIILSVLALKPLLPIPLILLGLTAGQYRIFENLGGKRKKVALFTAIMFVLSVIALIYQNLQAPSTSFNSMELYQFYHTGIMIGPIISAFYVGLLITLLQIPFIQKVLSPLKNYGRMSLTNYLMQTVLILLVGNVFDLFGQLTYLQTLFLCIAIYAIQLVYSIIWLHFFRFGPMEWIWRVLTYLEVMSMMKYEEITRKDASK